MLLQILFIVLVIAFLAWAVNSTNNPTSSKKTPSSSANYSQNSGRRQGSKEFTRWDGKSPLGSVSAPKNSIPRNWRKETSTSSTDKYTFVTTKYYDEKGRLMKTETEKI